MEYTISNNDDEYTSSSSSINTYETHPSKCDSCACTKLECRTKLEGIRMVKCSFYTEKKITQVHSMEHYDQHESTNNCAKKYIVEFTDGVNSEWLWETLNRELLKASTLK